MWPKNFSITKYKWGYILTNALISNFCTPTQPEEVFTWNYFSRRLHSISFSPPFPGIPLLYNGHLTTNPSLKGTGFLPDGEPEVVALLWISNDSSELLTPSSFLCFLHQMFWSLKWYFLVHVYLSLTKFCWIAKFCTNVCCCTTTGLTLNFRLILLDFLIYIDLT